jgi:hypothetical protein
MNALVWIFRSMAKKATIGRTRVVGFELEL